MWEIVVATIISVGPMPLDVPAAPNDRITKCSQVEYRQNHLAECNKLEPRYGSGGTTGRRGLLGLGGIGGIL